jgi:cysteine-rich repeat protein
MTGTSLAGRSATRNRMNGSTYLLLWVAPLLSSCVVEQIDDILAERGVTYCPSSTGESEGGLETSTSADTRTESSTGVVSGSESSSTGGETSSSTTGAESTGPPVPVCGDGVVEGDEACDDGNAKPADGCQECAKDSVVFVTSEVYQGYALDGLYGADQRCRSLAAKAGLDRFLTFKAWLSTPTMSVADRFVHSRGRYVLVNGLVVAQNWDALTSGTIENPIVVDEYSQTQDSAVWTGTLASGEPALGSEFCEDWADDSGLLKFAGTGFSTATDATWSFFEQGGCGSELRLYCVEQ